MLFTRCLPRSSNGLANITATLGSFYWLGFETSGLSPDKKRLALLGAQQFLFVGSRSGISHGVDEMRKQIFHLYCKGIFLCRVYISGKV
jgi:hypothetical protein